MNAALKTKRALVPQDFKAPLYAGLTARGGWFFNRRERLLLPLVPMEWGQPEIVFHPLGEDGTYVGMNVYDREDGGGDPLIEGTMDEPTEMRRGDTVNCFVRWPV